MDCLSWLRIAYAVGDVVTVRGTGGAQWRPSIFALFGYAISRAACIYPKQSGGDDHRI